MPRCRGAQAWTRASLSPSDWLVRLDPACLAELRAVVAELRRAPVPTLLLSPDDFALAACAQTMRGVRHMLDAGAGFALLDRLPMDELGKDEAIALYWLLASLLARPVAQKLDGTMIYDVHDTGQKALPGSGIRPDKTNIDLRFHNDNAYNTTPPEYVGLLCLRSARGGGLSRVMSFYTVHNALLERHANVVPRLYEPFPFDRQREFFAGEEPVFEAPMFAYDGALRVRLTLHQVRGGFALRGNGIDEASAAALDALEEVFADQSLQADFTLERGQMQFANNHTTGHARTEFEDHAEPELRRHLVRIWMRDRGARGYPG